MARSNSNQDRTGRPPRPAQPTEPGLPWNSQGGPAPVSPHEPQFAPQPAHGYDVPPTQHPQAGVAQLPWPSSAGQPQTYAQPTYAQQAPQPYGTAPVYPPHGYPPQQQPQAGYPAESQYYPQAYETAPAYPAAPQYADPGVPQHPYPSQGEMAYQPPNAQPTPYAPQYQTAPNGDPRGYDLGAYATGAGGYADPVTGRPTAPPAQGYAQEFAPQHGQGYQSQGHNSQGHNSQGHNSQGHPNLGRPGQPQHGLAQHGQPYDAAIDDEDAYDDDEEYDDEDVDPPRRFRFLKIAASLVIATGIGAGGAYAYKKFGWAPSMAKPTVVRADATPARVQAAAIDQGAAESKAGDRLGGAVPAVVPADVGSNGSSPEGDSPAGPRRVQTIAISPPGMAPAQPQPSIRPTISVPGVALDGMTPQGQPRSATASLPPVTPAPVGRAVAPPPVTAQQRAPVAPRVIASASDDATTAVAPQAPARQRVAVARAVPKAPKTSDAYSPGGAVAAVAPSAVGAPPAAPAKAANNGYIAVLASQGSAIDARKTLDDLQGRFGEILGGKPTDITEFANPKDGKTYYRAIVGPPGSREAAASVCARMRAAGYKDCFATAY